MKQPFPDAALDDRLGFVGTAGAGKTYNAMGRVERLLERGARVACIDPLGVFWGLRLKPDGKTESGFDIPIFGGPHGDLPLTEHSGALIGETVAGMAGSCIVDLSEIGTKAGERRFMLAFLTALYRKASGEPLHLIVDEADMFAPQKLTDRDGDAARLLGMMETVVRRGRIKGFVPWLITQRPAVIAKDILSQVDGLVAFKLTSSQDRKALGAWVEGSADEGQWSETYNLLPAMERGQGVVWIPGRGILETVKFPEKITFDSSRTPKRGEKKSTTALKPIDLGILKDRLATIDAETKANDPKALKAEIAKLTAEKATLGRQMAQAVAGKVVDDPEKIAKAEQRGYDRGYSEAIDQSASWARESFREIQSILREGIQSADNRILNALNGMPKKKSVSPAVRPTDTTPIKRTAPIPPRAPSPAASGDGTLTKPQRTLLRSLAWWRAMGHDTVTRAQIAVVAGWSPASSNVRDRLSEVSKLGFVEYPGTSMVRLTDAGVAAAPEPDVSATLIDSTKGILTNPQRTLFEALLSAHQERITPVSRAELASACGWSPDSSNVRDRLSELSRLELVAYPRSGMVELQPWVLG